MKRYISVFLVFVCFGVSPLAAKTQADVVKYPADALSELTKHKGWLNTSRPLVADDLRGRIVLVDFWTYCCINCLQIMPDIARLEQTYSAVLTVVGVHSAKFKNEADDENIRNAILRHDLQHPVVNDFDFSTWNAFHVSAWPTLVLINPKGLVEKVYSGEGHFDDIESDIGRLSSEYRDRLRKDALPLKAEASRAPRHVLDFPGKLVYAPDYKGKKALIIADSGHDRVVISGMDGTVLDVIGAGTKGRKDGNFEQAQFSGPQGLLLKDDTLYIADTGNHLLRTVDLKTRKVVTLAGDGGKGTLYDVRDAVAMEASLASPWDVAFWPDERHIVIAMAGLHQLWTYDVDEKTVSVLAGTGVEGLRDGAALQAHLAQPSGLSVLGGKLYFVDAETSSLRVLDKGQVKTLIGSGLFDFGYAEGAKGKALLQHPLGLVATGKGIFIADSFNHSIARYDVGRRVLEHFSGGGVRGAENGVIASASFNEPAGIIAQGDMLYVADTNNQGLRVIDLQKRNVSPLVVQEQVVGEDIALAESLPNVMESEPLMLAISSPVQITLGLKKGWHINQDAPSFLALFDLVDDNAVVASFDRAALQQGVVSLEPREGVMYRLQGTFYYCEDKEGSQCMVKSVDIPVGFVKDARKQYTLGIN